MQPPTVPASRAIAARLQEAIALHNAGQLLRAQQVYEEILKVQPRHFDALHLLGVAAASSGDPLKAVDLIGKAIQLDPANPMAHNNRGAALLDSGLWEAALVSFDRAIALKHEYTEAHYNRGNALKELHRWEDALASFDKALSLMPAHAQAHYHRAIVLCAQRQWEAALAGFGRAIALRPDYAEAHANRGFVLHELRRLEESMASCNRAIELEPGYVEAYCNRGSVLLAMRRVPEALSSYDRALEIDPAYASGHVNRALALLLAGDYERGWAENEWRWKDETSWVIREKRGFLKPLWVGGVSPAGKTILLQSEQGYGDTIQFCRYAPLVADLGARVILEVPRSLARLAGSLEGVSQVVVQGERLPDFDLYCPLLSLPLALKTTLPSVPARVPYLAAPEARRRFWQDKLGDRRRPRIGLVWSGGLRPARPELWSVNERRNIPLGKLAAFKDFDADFYSLQKGEPAESELADLSRGWGGPDIVNFAAELTDFAESVWRRVVIPPFKL